MRTVSQLLERKGSKVITITPDATVKDAAKLMSDHHIGAVMVVKGEGEIAGIFSERDVMGRVVAEGRDASTTRVREVMTTAVAYCTTKTTLDEVRSLMRTKKIRHMPVVEDGRLVGILSLGDLNIVQDEIHVETIQYLEQYMYKP